ncbi:DUF4396 domain-containing protein [Robbsia sp. Bb-Pol-6]|uniref:DUF4396 domain-containing protein n=1 Tax=Robbsia betulipollinis TaxID=2981849 RepID=A0ABT3ZJH2_9BURK|nr:DUF4396 domain-containing protein [Robbsia betulipollinis]MCY0386678.1 DUF4396 domain-containing protein [Robbsia betulipollinis]
MKIMEAVWPLTMLYWGPVGIAAYLWFGRAERSGQHDHRGGSMAMNGHGKEKPMWQATFVGASHCGAGCAVGDFIGDWFAFGLGMTVFGSLLGGTYLCAFVLAYLFGVLFQYFSVAPMQGLNVRDGIIAAIKIDTLSLLAYEVGMFAWMGFRAWRFPDMVPTQWSYWFMMQIAMMIGFATTYPLNWWLIKRGIKEKM